MSTRTGTQLFAKATIADDTIPAQVADQSEINGGWHSVADIAARDATALQYRRWGMVVNVENDTDTANNKQWVLTRPNTSTADDEAAALMDNGNWVELATSAAVVNYRLINSPGNITINSNDDIVVKSYAGDGGNYVYTLPPAASVPAGKKIIIGDVNGSFTGNYGIIIAASSGDNVNGASYLPTNYSPYFQVALISDNVSSWNADLSAVKYSGNTRDLDLGAHNVHANGIYANNEIVCVNFYSPVNNFHISATSIDTSGDFAFGNVGGDGGMPGWRYRHSDGRMLFYGLLQASKTALIGSSDSISPNAVLQADSTTKGFLPPRMTTTQRTAIPIPDEGLTIYDLTLHKLFVFDGTAWQAAW